MDPTAAPGGKEFFDEEVGNIVGGFPIEIKTKIRYLIICCCHIFIR